ncbi:hypothetical protein BDFB_008449 [Asbolus verrucosus]|jgi:hypothetical protein
MGKN